MLKINSTDQAFCKCLDKEESGGEQGWSETSSKEEEDERKDGRILKGKKGPAGSSFSVYEVFSHLHSLGS